MSSELKKRIVVTLVILFVARFLSYLPIPTINLAAISSLIQTATPEAAFNAGALSRAYIGTLGLFPYLSASVVVILVLYFRRFRHGANDREVRVEFYTICLAVAIALMQSYGVAVFLETLRLPADGSLLVLNPGWVFRGVTMLAMTAGTMLLIWLANLISQKGIGNGVCLIVLTTFVERLPGELAEFGQQLKSGNWELTDVAIIFVPLAIILFWAAFALVVARWSPPVRQSPLDSVFSAPLQLRVNGAGVGGLHWALSLLFIPATLVIFLPTGSLGKRLLESMTNPGVAYWVAFGIIAFAFTYFLTAWAYRPSGLQGTLSKFGNAAAFSFPALSEKEYEKKLAIVTLLMALGLPIIYIAASELMRNFSFYILSPIMLLPLVAIALDGCRQFKVHRQMGAISLDAEKENACEECGAGVGNADEFCPACGAVFAEKLRCDAHPEAAAFAVCVVCQKKLCQECSVAVSGHHTCEAHENVEWISGWATAAIFPTHLEAELSRQHLKEHGLAALVLSNTIEPLSGTLGLFTINAVTPFFAYREIGGGRIRLMTPARDLRRAQDYLAEINKEAEQYD